MTHESAAPAVAQSSLDVSDGQGNIKAAGAQRVKLKDCLLNHGSSGGPFLRAWDNDLRFGYVNSVMSYKYSGNMYGPYFDDDTLDIYNVAKNKE